MKKLVLALAVLAVVSGAVSAVDLLQYPPPLAGGGNIMVDVGIGLSHSYGASNTKIRVPPLYAVVEYALPVKVPISVGGIFAFSQYRWDGYITYGDYSWTYTYVMIAARANWHWAFDVKWLDFYTGLSLGWNIGNSEYDGPSGYKPSSSPVSGFTGGPQVGAHFYFTKTVGAVAEFGYPIFAKVGLALKF
ncbi:MAG: hypothetical protein LBF74_02630 [Treponema sp.]|jgi:hypothetical protein|nr:hypothetical protein [Treponema sp.]